MRIDSENPSPEDGGASGQPPPAGGDSVEYIKQYIDASAESADRARFVLLALITASVLAYVAMWNSRPQAWMNSRRVIAIHAQKFYVTETSERDGQQVTTERLVRNEQEAREKVWPLFIPREEYDRQPEKTKEAYLKGREALYNSVREYVNASTFADRDHLKKYVETLDRARTEKVLTISVPFFGTVFDINDLGLFAGITFIIVLLLFRFSLLRELRNVRLVFKQARTPEHLLLCYNMLAMQQVLTTPPQLDYQPPKGGVRRALSRIGGALWEFAPKVLYFLPLLVHARILYNDYHTYETVSKVFPGVVNDLILNFVLLGVNVLLTVLCFRLGWRVDKTWKNHAKWIRDKLPKHPGVAHDDETPRGGLPETEPAASGA